MAMRNRIIGLLQKGFADNNATDYKKNFLINIVIVNMMLIQFEIIHCVLVHDNASDMHI